MSNSDKSALHPAIAYYRYSPGGGQTEQSIEGQRRDCTAYAKSHGYVITKEYIDRHLTGTNDRRPAFRLMLADAAQHKFDTLIAWKNDRISRNRRDALNYKEQLKQCGVRILYAQMDIPAGPEGILMESLMDGLAEYYSAELSQKISRGMTESAYKCRALGSKPPFGLAVKDHKYVPDPVTAPYVRWIFEQYAQGTPKKCICETLNAQGIRSSKGNTFGYSSLDHILSNEKYIGVYEAKGIRTENAIEPIISKELFYAVQALRPTLNHTSSRARAKHDYPLTGKLYCARCGQPMICLSGTGKAGVTYYYYTCRGHRNRSGCRLPNVRQPQLDADVLRITTDYLLQPDVLASVSAQVSATAAAASPQAAEIASTESALKDVRRRMQNILDVMEQGNAPSTLLSRLQSLEANEHRLTASLSALRRRTHDLSADRIEFMLTRMRQSKTEQPDAYAMRMLKTFVQRVDYSTTSVKVTYTLTKNAAAPYGAAASPSQNTRVLDKIQCSTESSYGGASPRRNKHILLFNTAKIFASYDSFSIQVSYA